jgi:hypothetical protein
MPPSAASVIGASPFQSPGKDGIATPLSEKDLPLELPFIDKYGPGPEGEGPLANIPAWTARTSRPIPCPVMPAAAGISFAIWTRKTTETFCSRAASDYWGQVDLYIGGAEHAVGHLLYSRMWTKFLHDRGWIGHDEPYKRLVNQGMIQGSSRFVYRLGAPRYRRYRRAIPPNARLPSAGLAALDNNPQVHDLITQAVRDFYGNYDIDLDNYQLSPPACRR